MMSPYELPDGSIVMIHDDTSRRLPRIDYTLKGGDVVWAVRVNGADRMRAIHDSKPQPDALTTVDGFGLKLLLWLMQNNGVGYGWLTETELRLVHAATMTALLNPDMLAHTREALQAIRKRCYTVLTRDVNTIADASRVLAGPEPNRPQGNSHVRPIDAPKPAPVAPAFEVNF